jgi:hypothetical protein
VRLESLSAAAFGLRIYIAVKDGLQFITSLGIFMFPEAGSSDAT